MDMSLVVMLESDYFLEKIGDEIIVYHPSLTTSLYFNKTGSLIWELCDGKRSVADISDILVALYPESSSNIQDDVLDIIGRLVENNIAVLREG